MAEEVEDVAVPSLGRPSIRVWELDADSSRYDRMKAAPSDAQMHNLWTAWSVLFFAFAIFNIIVFLAVILQKKTRRNPFNQYLLYIMFPDVVNTGLCAVQCAYLAGAGGYTDPALCRFQSFYLVWSIASNSWLNAVAAFEVHRLLKHSNRRLHYFPPTARQVRCKSIIVYLFAAFLASWGVVSVPWLPYETNSASGLVCIPFQFDRASTIFFWLVFIPLLMGLPLLYGVYVTIHVLYHGLLPPSGQKREIAVFFLRIIVVFAVMWLPSIVFVFALSGVNTWVLYISSIWAHMQGTVSAAVCMIKSDIRRAVQDFLTCRTWEANRRFVESTASSRRLWLQWNSQRQFSSSSNNNSNKLFLVDNSSSRNSHPAQSSSLELITIPEGGGGGEGTKSGTANEKKFPDHKAINNSQNDGEDGDLSSEEDDDAMIIRTSHSSFCENSSVDTAVTHEVTAHPPSGELVVEECSSSATTDKAPDVPRTNDEENLSAGAAT